MTPTASVVQWLEQRLRSTPLIQLAQPSVSSISGWATVLGIDLKQILKGNQIGRNVGGQVLRFGLDDQTRGCYCFNQSLYLHKHSIQGLFPILFHPNQLFRSKAQRLGLLE